MQVEELSKPVSPSSISGVASHGRSVAVVMVLFAAVVLLQWRTGAFTAELSGYPDEASHYMSGLLVHDYIAGGFAARPMQFAQNFYLHYPYLAIGHWPPVFYVLEGAWMLLFSPARISVMLLMALITALLGLTTYRITRASFGATGAWIITLLFICNPLVLQYTSMVMIETLLALFSLCAVVCFGRFLDTERWQESASFAVFATFAIMTKANGFELALVPLFGVAACRKLYLMKRLSFWLPAAAVALICVPWHLLTLHLMLPTFTAEAGLTFTKKALTFYSLAGFQALAIGLACLACLGVFDRVIRPLRSNRVEGKWAVLAALPLSVILFHSIVSGGLEKRYLVTAIAPLLMLSAAGASFVAERFSTIAINVRWKQQIVLTVATLVFAKMSFTLPTKVSFGFKDAAAHILSDHNLRNSLILVSSETTVGEGIFVSEVAMRDHGLDHVVLRASKVLAEGGWNQSTEDYRPLFSDSEAVRQCIEQAEIRSVVVDTSRGRDAYQDHRQILEMVKRHPEDWQLSGSFGAGGTQPVQLYSFVGVPNNSTLADSEPLRRIRTNVDNPLKNWPIRERLVCPSVDEATHSRASR